MRISDWSSDVCSSDLAEERQRVGRMAVRVADDVVRIAPVAGDGLRQRVGFGLRGRCGLGGLGAGLRRGRGESARGECDGEGAGSQDGSHGRAPIGVEGKRATTGCVWCGRRKRSEEHTSELQSLMRISYAVFCLKKKKIKFTT